MKKYIVGIVTDVLNEKQRAAYEIIQTIDVAAETVEKAKASLSSAFAEVNRLMEEAHVVYKTIVDEAVAEAKTRADEILARAKEQLDQK